MKNINLHQQKIEDSVTNENDIILYDSNKTTNTQLVIVSKNWYKDNNDKDIQELDKVMELIKIIFLKILGFLDIIT